MTLLSIFPTIAIVEGKCTSSMDWFMDAIVLSFLILGMIIIFFSFFIIFLSEAEGGWRKAAEIFLPIYLYILVNYLIWFVLHEKFPEMPRLRIVMISFVVMGIGFCVYPIVRMKDGFYQKRWKKELEKIKWKCTVCGTINRHSVKCWNCDADKLVV